MRIVADALNGGVRCRFSIGRCLGSLLLLLFFSSFCGYDSFLVLLDLTLAFTSLALSTFLFQASCLINLALGLSTLRCLRRLLLVVTRLLVKTRLLSSLYELSLLGIALLLLLTLCFLLALYGDLLILSCGLFHL